MITFPNAKINLGLNIVIVTQIGSCMVLKLLQQSIVEVYMTE